MIYRRRRSRSSRGPSGFYQIESTSQPANLHGFGDGEFVRLRDEHGQLWQGSVDAMGDDVVRYRFRNDKGKSISGISDRFGILLRDEKGNSWRGYVY